MKLSRCWVLAALGVCGASAFQVDWDAVSSPNSGYESYDVGTVHSIDDVKQSDPATRVPTASSVSPTKAPVATSMHTKAPTPAAVSSKAPTPASVSSKVPVPATTPSKVPTPAITPSKAPAVSTAPTKTPTPVPAADGDVGDDVGDTNTDNTDNTTTSGAILQAFGTDAPSETLFKRNANLGKLAPIVNLAQSIVKEQRPIPTNKWWGNLIHTTEKDRLTVANPAWSNPYAVKLPVKEAPFGLQTCYSYSYRRKAGVANDKIKFYLHEYHNDVTLSAQEFTAKPDYEIYDWSDLGANVRICAAGGGKCMESALVNGMAFISSTYAGLTPKIVSEYAISKLEAGAAKGKYVIQLANKQTWVLYSSGAVTFKVDGKSIVGSGAYTGSIRVAVLPESASADVYDAYAGCTVLGAQLGVASRTKYSFDWAVAGSSCESTGLLHFALQHQVDSMGGTANSTAESIVLQSSVRGAMTGVVAKKTGGALKWVLTEPELAEQIGFYPPRKPSGAVATQIKQQLEKDIASEWKLAKDGSYYFNGKAYQKYASLCLLADDASVVGSDTSLKTKCVAKLEALIEPFLTNGWASPLVYETTYRGLVTSQMFTANDVNVDFGNGVYNDHHYHYGYWVVASAMLKKLDPEWSRMPELEKMVWSLLRDVANPSSEDKYFPKFRHFSWFLGHSYSHGVTPLADGKDQESTSEDINFLYGMMLWGQVTGKKAVEDLGSLMLRVDARAIRTYFLMDSSNKVHPPEFVRNHVTGIFFDNKVDYATWFSPEKYCIHGIQMIPVSPINEIVRSRQFVKEEWDDVLSKEAIVKDASSTIAWLSLLYVNYAAVNQQEALQRLAKVDMDDGLTRSWALYNAATRKTAAK